MTRSLLGALALLALTACDQGTDRIVDFGDGNSVSVKSVDLDTTIEQCVDPGGDYMGEAWCPNVDGDGAYPVDSAVPFGGTAPTCLCLSAGDPGEDWDMVTTTSEIASYDCDDTNSAVNPDATEVCDGVDNNCDGNVDEDGGSTTYYLDADHDGFGDASMTSEACDMPEGYVSNSGDCNDSEILAYTGATEACDDVDNDCDGSVDEGVTNTFYADTDSDGYGDPLMTVAACDMPEGYVSNSGDCDDDNVDINPIGNEVCDDGNVDEDCDGLVDDADDSATGQTTWYADSDGDGFGLTDSGTVSMCDISEGYSALSTDCDDDDVFTYPGAAYEESLTDCMTDVDEDGWGDEISIGVAGTDCNDTDDSVNPNASDVADDGIDSDCDNVADDLICKWDIFTSTSVQTQLWAESTDTSADDATWNYPGLAGATASSTTPLCVSRTIVGGEHWKIQGQYSLTATSSVFYASDWSFSGYGNGYTNFAAVTAMGEAVTVSTPSWGGGVDGYFTVAATLPN